jgi:hypothetical protein
MSEFVSDKTLPLLVVIPWQFKSNWDLGRGNFYFEIVQSLVEVYGNENILIYQVDEFDYWWKENLLSFIKRVDPNSILLSSEIDPDGSHTWTLDEFIRGLRTFWKKKVFYLLFDSVFPLHQWRLDRLIRYDRNVTVISIDQSRGTTSKGAAANIGPCFLPISRASIDFLRIESEKKILVENLEPFEISFIGKIYPYRRSLLEKYSSQAPKIKVNPQSNFLDSDSYLSYITALRLSKYTLNFSRANVINKSQLKCRVLEAALFGCCVISDESKYSSKFFENGNHFIVCSDIEILDSVLKKHMNFGPRQDALIARAEEVNSLFSSFFN